MKKLTKPVISMLLALLMLFGLIFSSFITVNAYATKAAFADYAYSKVGAAKSTFSPEIGINDVWCAQFVSYCAIKSGFKTSSTASDLTNSSRAVPAICADPQKGDTAYILVQGAGHWGVIYSCTSSTLVTIEANSNYNYGNLYSPPQRVYYRWTPTMTYTPGAPNGYYRRDDGADVYVYRYCKN